MVDLETFQKQILSSRNECCWAQFRNPKNLVEVSPLEAGMQSRNLSTKEFTDA